MADNKTKTDKWQDVIIDGQYATLTKKQVHDYYTNPTVKREILKALGDSDAVVRQSFTAGNDVLKRKTQAGSNITREDLPDLIKKRLTEVHPTFGKSVNFMLADIDPQKNVPWEKTKAIAETVAKTMQNHPDVKKVDIAFSGGRGFYVKGIMNKALNIDKARELTKEVLKGIEKRPDMTFGIAHAPNQIRIDTTPLKYKGSVRAPYSLNASTGLVSTPVTLAELPKVKKENFTIQNIVKKAAEFNPAAFTHLLDDAIIFAPRIFNKDHARAHEVPYTQERPQPVEPYIHAKLSAIKISAEAEFAPGIPKSRTVHDVPSVKDKAWQLAIQEHKADKAGPHWDLRLVDPETHRAHSFAVPKMKFPEGKETILGVQQPTHTSDYALNFEGNIPKGTYGAGSVKMHLNEPVQVIKATADKIHLQRPGGENYVMFRMKDKNWGIRKTTP